MKAPELKSFVQKAVGTMNMNRSVLPQGRVIRVTGGLIEADGPVVEKGALMALGEPGKEVLAEVVGFGERGPLMVTLEESLGLRPGMRVCARQQGFKIPVGPDLLGRVIDGLGRPIDGKGPLKGRPRSVFGRAPGALQRPRIDEPFFTGVKSIDSILTCGKGQRLGIFAGSGVGKSTLLGMISRNCLSQVNVIALIGERGREVLEFIEDTLGEEGMARSIVVAVTSDAEPLHRLRGGDTAMAIAEYFRDQGMDVLFIMDSVTRYAMAMREIGLAAGEPPATKGYPPSVFAALPRLLERAGRNEKGSITAFITVLVEGDDMNEPIADAVRGILDGHIILSRKIATQGLYPCIDIPASLSRVMKDVTGVEHQQAAVQVRRYISDYREAEDLINIGAYVPGSNKDIDIAVNKRDLVQAFLRQHITDPVTFETTLQQLAVVVQ